MGDFTPGSWRVCDAVTGPTAPAVGGPTCGESVAIAGQCQDCNGCDNCYRHISIGVGQHPLAIVVWPKHSEEEGNANARLIAAAPTLLAACEGLLALTDAHGWGEGPARRAAVAAISLAKGGATCSPK